MAKEGSTIGGLMDCFGTAVSMSLQYGVPLEVYVNKFSHTRFEPWGYTKNPDIKIAKSLVDYIFRWLGITFLPGYGEMNKAVPVSPAEAGQSSLGPAGEIEAESRPVATKVGGPNSGQGASKSQARRAGQRRGCQRQRQQQWIARFQWDQRANGTNGQRQRRGAGEEACGSWRRQRQRRQPPRGLR